jgi:putative ABC transport system permease protein
MNRTFAKDIRRLIGATKGRFFSLLAIVAIGVAFFVGVSASSPVMSASVDSYDDETNLKDITVYSNYGLDAEDLAAIKAVPEVADAELAQFVDVTGVSGTTSYVTRIHSYSADAAINQFVLKKGRLPQNEHECLAENGSALEAGFALDSTVTFSRPDDDLGDYLTVTSCQVVGTVDTPLYLDEAKENSTLNNQYIRTYLYLPESAFDMDYYMEANVLVKDAKTYNSFSSAYETYTKKVKAEIETLAETQAAHRHDVVVAKAQKEYDDGLKDYNDGLQEYNDKIADAEQKVADGEQDIADGEKAIADAQQELKDAQEKLDAGYVDGANQIHSARSQLDKGAATLKEKQQEFSETKAELNENIAQIDAGTAQIDTALTALNTALTGIQQLDQGIAAMENPEIKSGLSGIQALLGSCPPNTSFDGLYQIIRGNPSITDPDKTIEGIKSLKQLLEQVTQKEIAAPADLLADINSYDAIEAGLTAKRTKALITLSDNFKTTFSSADDISTVIQGYEANKADLLSKRDQITSGIEQGEQQLADAQAEIDKGYEQATNASVELDQKIADGQKEIDDGWATLNGKKADLEQGKSDLAEARQKLADAKQDGNQELEDAKSKLDKAKQDIDDLETGKWTVLDRTEHYASAAYKNTVHQMRAIAAIFPVFFFMVAALVCLTTMTRMVDEQRGQIGILRALGYTQSQCTRKYLIYAGTATLIGALIGDVAGLLIFPSIIYNTWRMMYILPAMKLDIPWTLIVLTDLCFLGVMLYTTWSACHADMREVPAQLMRPKAPRLGKSTFIEKIPLIWNHLSFTWKVTIRNLIRYKKRFFMTVFGVAGCTALLITGYGIRDSIKTIATKQFEEIYRYDGTAEFSKDLSATEVDSVYQSYASRDDVADSMLLTGYSGKITSSGADDETAYVQVFDEPEDITHMYLLRTRVRHTPLSLGDDGVIINEKLAQNLNKKVGDTITVESKDGVRADVKISGICEMYVRHYVFMTKAYYKTVFGTAPADNTMALKMKGSLADSQSLQQELTSSSDFSGVEFFDVLLNNFNNMIKGLDVIVLVLIISSASLAGVVLGNLTNVNISERLREIATLKVLGFRRKEVENYIYKENNILTLIGSLIGVPLGIVLHYYIMHQVEMDYVMFGRQISLSSFLICIAMTLAFGMLVNLFMARRLHRIQMVESLKSVE